MYTVEIRLFKDWHHFATTLLFATAVVYARHRPSWAEEARVTEGGKVRWSSSDGSDGWASHGF